LKSVDNYTRATLAWTRCVQHKGCMFGEPIYINSCLRPSGAGVSTAPAAMETMTVKCPCGRRVIDNYHSYVPLLLQAAAVTPFPKRLMRRVMHVLIMQVARQASQASRAVQPCKEQGCQWHTVRRSCKRALRSVVGFEGKASPSLRIAFHRRVEVSCCASCSANSRWSL